MIELIIPACIIIIVMALFIFFVLKIVLDKINTNSKKFFIDKLQDYDKVIDFIIEKKKKELEELENKISEIKKREHVYEDINLLEQYERNTKEVEIKNEKESEIIEPEAIYQVSTPEYREEEFFNTYRSVKQQFNLDNEKIIKKFLKTHNNKDELKEYELLKKFRNYFDEETLYQCLTLSKEEQYAVLQSVTKKKEKQILKLDTYSEKKFDLMKFIEDIEKRMEEIDPSIYVYVRDKNLDYSYLSEYVKTSVYQNMIEGIIISYKGQTYDYSI